MEKLLRNFFQGQVDRKETSLETRFSWAFSIYKKNGKFLLGIPIWEEWVPFVTSPIRSQAPLCRLDAFSKLFYYFLEQVFLSPFSAKQILIIGICGYEKTDICIVPSF